MDWLNYHHLFYFWVITREGGLAKAARRLRLTHPTLSAQLRELERFFGAPLFDRRGRRLGLTPFGAEVAAYATEIFRIGGELVDVARSGKPGFRIGFRVGVVGALPKTVTHRLLLPALELDGVGPMQVRQDNYARLLEELAANRLHLVLSDAPPADRSSMRLHAHLLGETPIFLYGTPRLAGRYKARFPDGLSDAPLLLPSTGSSLRRLIDRWLVERGLRVRIEGEFDDAGLMRVFGGAGRGLFPVRAALRTEVEESYGAVSLGELEGIRERYYAVSVERRVRHRGVAAIIESARSSLARPRRGFR